MDCCICLEPMNEYSPSVSLTTCCGNSYHRKCMNTSLSFKPECPLCRQKVPGTKKQSLAYIRIHVKNNKPWAFCLIGIYYLRGWAGLTKSDRLAEAFFERGIYLGRCDQYMIREAKYELARLLRFRKPFTQERTTRASNLMKEAAEAGHVRAKWVLDQNFSVFSPDGIESPLF